MKLDRHTTAATQLKAHAAIQSPADSGPLSGKRSLQLAYSASNRRLCPVQKVLGFPSIRHNGIRDCLLSAATMEPDLQPIKCEISTTISATCQDGILDRVAPKDTCNFGIKS
eukprot:Em0002g99a